MDQGLIDRFSILLKGYEKAHGRHFLDKEADEQGKLQGRAKTIVGPCSLTGYKDHLEGAEGSYGIIPLLENNKCWFGVIDIDIKGQVKLKESHEALLAKIIQHKLPLVMCRSKSNGVHLYLFGKEELNSRMLQSRLAEFAAILGYGGCEIFPKQTTRANDKDYGNWINVCYYGETRKCLTTDGELNLEQFLEYAENKRISEKELMEFAIPLCDEFSDGPPCLQQLTTFGFLEGGRNNALLNVAIYFKKKFPDDWQDKVMKFNFDQMQPPLASMEVNTIVKSVTKKEYNYLCKQPPIVSCCNRKLCLKRDYGVGSHDSKEELAPIESLTKCVAGQSVRWYIDIQGERIELTTDQLLNQEALQKILLERLSIVISSVKKEKWMKKIQELVQTQEVIEDPEDASRFGQFDKLLDSYFLKSRPARNKDELIKGNWWENDSRMHFLSEDLFNYLNSRKFAHNTHEIWNWLKDGRGAKHCRLVIKGKRTRVWTIPALDGYNNEDLPVPEFNEDNNHQEEEL